MNDRLDALIAAKKAHSDILIGSIPAGHNCGPITVAQSQWDNLTAASDAEKEARAALVPTEKDAINLMHDCFQRLKELGWNDAVYCPKDGSEFDAIEAGSTGIHRCHYDGEWPNGHWWIAEAGDLWPSRPILYRVSEEEKARWKAAGPKIRALRDEFALAAGSGTAETGETPAQCEASQSGGNEDCRNAQMLGIPTIQPLNPPSNKGC